MVACGKPGSIEVPPDAAVTEMRGASIASWRLILWSIRFIVTWRTELMIVAPPGDPRATMGLPCGSKIMVGAMLLRGRFSGATSFVPIVPVYGLVDGVVLKSVSSLLSRKPKLRNCPFG